MYRDDTCAVCGESLPPDHIYCRTHAVEVDDRLHEIGVLLPKAAEDLDRLAELVAGVAQETWDYVAESEADDPPWPPLPQFALRADAEEVAIDVDTEPGLVQVSVRVALGHLLRAMSDVLADDDLHRLAEVAARIHGANTER